MKVRNKKDNDKKLSCGNCGNCLRLQTPPDGVIIFSCEECGNKVSWKINTLTNKIDTNYSPQKSKGIEFTKMERSIVKIAITVIIFLSVVLLFYLFLKK